MTSPPADETTAPPTERVVARLRPHARMLFWPSLVLVAVCGAAGYVGGTFDQLWQNLLVYGGGFVIVLLLFFLPLASWLSKRYTITTRRVILRRGFFVRVRQELLHTRGYDVVLKRNVLQAMFRSGDIRINFGLETPVVLRDVPRAVLVQAALQDLMDVNRNIVAVRRQEESALADETAVWGTR